MLSVALKIVGHSGAVKKLDLSENDFGIEGVEVRKLGFEMSRGSRRNFEVKRGFCGFVCVLNDA